MPFESLSEKIQYSLRKLTGRGKVNEKDIDDAMRETGSCGSQRGGGTDRMS